MKRQYFVYIATNKNNGVLYTGVTNNIINRIKQHKSGKGSIFTNKYNINKLVYFEVFDYIHNAISREKQIKTGSRKKKMELITKNNPNFNDLFEEIIK